MLARTPAYTLDELGLARIWLRERDGIWCLVDAQDYEWLSAWRWNVGWHAKTRWKFYAKRNVGPGRLTVYMAREILARATEADEDFVSRHVGHHRNGQSLDNRRANLAYETLAENSRMRVKRGVAPSLEEIVAKIAAQRQAVAGAEIPF